MGVQLSPENTMVLDLSEMNPSLTREVFEGDQSFKSFLSSQLRDSKKTFALGGYLEKRTIYTRSKVFAIREATFRNTHLGVDIWTDGGNPVFCPIAGKVHSFRDNLGFGNYGPTLILEHQLLDNSIYSLYGHLSRKDMMNWKIGKPIECGEVIGHLGSWEENGCWPPHLHFQLIKNLGNHFGDYPGVCEEENLPEYKVNCPDPNTWINCSLLK